MDLRTRISVVLSKRLVVVFSALVSAAYVITNARFKDSDFTPYTHVLVSPDDFVSTPILEGLLMFDFLLLPLDSC